MNDINQKVDTPLIEESKQNLQKSNSQLPTQEATSKAKNPRRNRKQPEELITLSSGKTYSKKRFMQMQQALGAITTLKLPHDIIDDGSYEYFWASTQYNGQIQQKQNLGYEVCTNDKNAEYRQYAGMDNNIRHEHVLMRIKKEDRDVISYIQHRKKILREHEQVTKNRKGEGFYEKEEKLRADGEVTFEESLLNKYNNNKIKQV